MASRRAFFGDNDGSRVLVVDLDTYAHWEVATGLGSYPVDRVSATHVLASTRNEAAVTAISIADRHATFRVALRHQPRSATWHPKKRPLALVSGADCVMTTVLDLSMTPYAEIGHVGSGDTAEVRDYGGRLRTGHPYWMDEDSDRFFQLDRVNRRIEAYRIGDTSPFSTVATPTSVHEVTRLSGEAGRWFAVCEGNSSDGIPPSLLRIEERDGKLEAADNLPLPVNPADRPRMGGHHVDEHPDGKHLYFGSAEGILYLIDRHAFAVVAQVDTGRGHGHTRVARGLGLAISTNHDDSYISVLDTATNKKVKDIEVSRAPAGPGKKRQGHTSAVDPNGRLFYHSASSDGDFYVVDLEKLEVVHRVHLGGYPIQGTFVW